MFKSKAEKAENIRHYRDEMHKLSMLCNKKSPEAQTLIKKIADAERSVPWLARSDWWKRYR